MFSRALLSIYRSLAGILRYFLPRYLHQRTLTGKEEALRLKERQGYASLPRPEGKEVTLAWFHAASVGETMSLLPLLEIIRHRYPHVSCLVTTGTVTSAAIAAQRLPEGCFHQYAPLDVPQWVERFLEHWKPSLALFVESEIWPAQFQICAAQKIPLFLVNARLSDKSFRCWSRFPKTIKALLACCTHIMAQSSEIFSRFQSLGASSLSLTGNMKFAASPLPYDEEEVLQLKQSIGDRPLWAVASTHSGEEDIIADVIAIDEVHPNLLTLLAPRHPHRAEEVAQLLEKKGLRVVRRSRQEPITPETQVYLVDTMGELGLMYALAPIAFIGGTLMPIGGHNPIEAIQHHCALLWGPYRDKSRDICDLLQEAAFEVTDAASLRTTLHLLIHNISLREQSIRKAYEIYQHQQGVIERIMPIIEPFLCPK